MIVLPWILCSIIFISQCLGLRGELRVSHTTRAVWPASKENVGITTLVPASSTSAPLSPDSVLKAKFNFSTSGSFSGELGCFMPEKASQLKNKNTSVLLQETNPNEFLKRIVGAVLVDNKINPKNTTNWKERELDNCAEFKAPMEKDNEFQRRYPTVAFGFNNQCKFTKGLGWCYEVTLTEQCTWPSDCSCGTHLTCGPTKPCIEHEDKWCKVKGPRTTTSAQQMCNRLVTVPYCTTEMYTPCASFQQPRVAATRYTTEACVCSTVTPTCPPCQRKRSSSEGFDLYRILFKRSHPLYRLRESLSTNISHPSSNNFHNIMKKSLIKSDSTNLFDDNQKTLFKRFLPTNSLESFDDDKLTRFNVSKKESNFIRKRSLPETNLNDMSIRELRRILRKSFPIKQYRDVVS